MIEKVLSIKESTQEMSKTDKPYLKIIDQDGTKFSCWDESLWNSLGKNLSVKVGFEQKGIFKNIVAVEAMEKALAERTIKEQPKVYEGQEIGLWWKETGEMIRAGYIKKETDVGGALYRAYFAKMLEVLGVKAEKKEE